MLVPKQVPDPKTNRPSIAYSLYMWQWDGNSWQLTVNKPLEFRVLGDARSELMIVVPALIQQILAHFSQPPPYRYLTLQVLTAAGWSPALSHGNWMGQPTLQI